MEKQGIGLVLLDIRLPFISGQNVFEIIRKDFPDKKIIVCSVLQKDEQQFFIYEADDYYYKSENLDILIEKVGKIVNNKNMKGTFGENDKRKCRRLPVNVLANCESLGPQANFDSSHFLSYTKDLSLLGGRFVIGEDIKVGQHFSAALELPVNFLPLLIDCEVVWVKKLEEFHSTPQKNVEAGVRFVKLDSPSDEEKLKNYLNFD